MQLHTNRPFHQARERADCDSQRCGASPQATTPTGSSSMSNGGPCCGSPTPPSSGRPVEACLTTNVHRTPIRLTCLHALPLLLLRNCLLYSCVASAGTCRIVGTRLPKAHGCAALQTRVDQCWLTVHSACNANIPAALLWQHQQTCETSHCQCECAVTCKGRGAALARRHPRARPVRAQAPAAAAADGRCSVAAFALPAAALISAALASADAMSGLAVAATALPPRRAASRALVLT